MLHDRTTHSYSTDAGDDVRDEPTRRTVEVVVQVLVDGEWHRQIPDMLAITACEKPFRWAAVARRREQLNSVGGKLCAQCFHRYEISRARVNDETSAAAEVEADRQWFADADARAEKRADSIARATERRDIATGRHPTITDTDDKKGTE
ncbi:MAG: hypothetical protein M3619_00550 [Myxococcota bacterium]|nr:hypothetical protein [Myxococcota bacterium]